MRRGIGAAAALGPGDELGDVVLVRVAGVRAAAGEGGRELAATPAATRHLRRWPFRHAHLAFRSQTARGRRYPPRAVSGTPPVPWHVCSVARVPRVDDGWYDELDGLGLAAAIRSGDVTATEVVDAPIRPHRDAATRR